MTGSEPNLTKPGEKPEDSYYLSYQFKNRLFDRDTLITQEYNINFLYVLTSYVMMDDDERFKKKVHDAFRKDMIEVFKAHYDFYVMVPSNGMKDINYFETLNFKRILGKLFRPYHEDHYLIMALSKDPKFAAENKEVMEYLEPSYDRLPYTLGEDPNIVYKEYLRHGRPH